jgi:AraC-like DNA-binding protein
MRVPSDFTIQFTYLRTVILPQLDKNWTIQAMASQVGLGRSKFHAVYKSLFGISPINDLINMRISTAKTLLLHSSKSISEIAEQLGYSNLPHFTKQFRAIVGVSPGQFRASPPINSNSPARVDMTQILSDALSYHHNTQQQYHEVRYIRKQKS